MKKRKSAEFSKMVFKDHYDCLSEEQRVLLRDAFISESGISLCSFYQKLRENKFRPLESKLFHRLLREFDKTVCV